MGETPSEPAPNTDSRAFELYKMAVDEYRFQVRLNWERTRDYLILNGALVSIAVGLQKRGDAANSLLVACMLLLACGVGVLGALAPSDGP